jgi:hypothetical protein
MPAFNFPGSNSKKAADEALLESIRELLREELKRLSELGDSTNEDLSQVLPNHTSLEEITEAVRGCLNEQGSAPNQVSVQIDAVAGELRQITTMLSTLRREIADLKQAKSAAPEYDPKEFERVVTAELQTLIQASLGCLQDEMKEDLEESVRVEMVEALRGEIEADQNHPLREAALKSIIRNPSTDVWNDAVSAIERQALQDDAHDLWDSLVDRLSKIFDFRQEAARRAEDAARIASKREMEADPNHRLRLQVIEELKRKPETLAKVREALRHELTPELKKELKMELRTTVHEELESELRLPLLFNRRGEVDGSVSSTVRRNLLAGMEDLREAVKDEIWETVVKAYYEGIGATEEMDEDQWNAFLKAARELVDDRLKPKHRIKRRRLRKPDGFFRAIEPTVCDRTGDTIAIGDYYLVFRGTTIGLPISEEEAEELVEETEKDEWSAFDTDPDHVEPPWDGFPWDGDGPEQPRNAG